MAALTGQLDRWQEMGSESRGRARSQGPQVGLKPRAAAARTEPLYTGHTLHNRATGAPNSIHTYFTKYHSAALTDNKIIFGHSP